MNDAARQHPRAEIRMRGFSQRSTVEAAWAWIDSVLPNFHEMPTEQVFLDVAHQRVLSCAVTSRVDVPGFARSMMDGFALQSEETHGATTYNPISFRIVGTCLPGQPFPRAVTSGEAVRIMTGAPLPVGADAVLPVEQTQLEKEMLFALDQVSAGKHVGQIGEDVRQGEVIFPAGRILRPQDLGVLSSIGVGSISAVRPPRVNIIITGNELLPAGSTPQPFQIADANGPMLTALVRRDGGATVGQVMVGDQPEHILAAFQEPVDVILVSGGTSVGQEDFVPQLLMEHGELAIHGVAMRPSSPAGMGRFQEKLVFLLPGNPVSCLCAYDFFAGYAIRALAGRSKAWPYMKSRQKLARKIVSTVGRVDYCRVTISGESVEPLAIGGASVLSSTTRADGFVIVPEGSEGYPAGADVDVFLYD